jgi:hypothetical protein
VVLELERGRRRVGRVGRGARAGGEEGIITVAHLYRAKTRASTNVPTFVPGGAFARYKYEDITFVSGGVGSGIAEPLCEDICTSW